MRRVVAVVITAALTAGACGDTSGGEGAVAAYFARAGAAGGELGRRIAAQTTAIQIAYQTPDRLFDTLAETDVVGAVEELEAELADLEPPPEFAEDHAAFTAGLERAITFVPDFETATSERDLVDTAILTSEMQVAIGTALAATSAAYCRAINVDSTIGPIEDICRPSQPVPGGDYGAAVNELMREISSGLGPRLGSFPIGLAPDQLFAILEVQQPHIEGVLNEVRTAMQDLEPPPELEAGDSRLLRYLDEITLIAGEITKAAAEGDHEAVLTWFDESGTSYCAAQAEFTGDFAAIVMPFFGDSC